MPRFQAVLFDFFGTLTHPVQRGPAHRCTAELLGCSTDRLVEVLDRTFYERASGRLGGAEATLRWVCAQAGVHPSDGALRAAMVTRHWAVRADTRLRADAVSTLAALRGRGIRTGLISDCTHELPAFLPHLAVAPLLDVRVLSVQFGRCKPDPALYLAACRRLGLPPERCLYVGDGGSQELTGAQRAGLTAFRLASPDLAGHLVFNPEHAWPGPVLRSLAEVVDLVTPAPRGPARHPPDRPTALAARHTPGSPTSALAVPAFTPAGTAFTPAGASAVPGGTASAPGGTAPVPGGTALTPAGAAFTPGGTGSAPGGTAVVPDGAGVDLGGVGGGRGGAVSATPDPVQPERPAGRPDRRGVPWRFGQGAVRQRVPGDRLPLR